MMDEKREYLGTIIDVSISFNFNYHISRLKYRCKWNYIRLKCFVYNTYKYESNLMLDAIGLTIILLANKN